MELEKWFELIGNFGFPIVITLYLLIRLEKRICDLTKAITKLIEIAKLK